MTANISSFKMIRQATKKILNYTEHFDEDEEEDEDDENDHFMEELIAKLILNVLTVVAHSVGLYLLSTVKRRRSSAAFNNMASYSNFVLLVFLSTTEALSGE